MKPSDVAVRNALRRVNTRARIRGGMVREADWTLILETHPDKPALDEVAAYYPLEASA